MLPVLDIAESITDALQSGNRLVLTAPTGSGKTTQVPQILLPQQPAGGRIVVLQPRRLAARMMAARVAGELRTPLGQLVGYQTRYESRMSDATRIAFATEGILLRMLQQQPTLPGVSAVILDEFHERTVDADLLLGLLAGLQESRRPDLKLVVMSATLDAAAVCEYLRCPAVRAEGRSYPVDVQYLARAGLAGEVWDVAARQIAEAVHANATGHILVFMPGVHEINRTIEAGRRLLIGSAQRFHFHPLHGSLAPAQQDVAVGPSEHRKIIVATNVAETSITIDGVTTVIDSGLARIHRYEAERSLNTLHIEPISRASADQRAGRAGRTAPGTCVRLWTEQDHFQVHPEHDEPEVLRIELGETLLRLHAMGMHDARRFAWLSPPREEAIARAEDLLYRLHATGADPTGLWKPTRVGRAMAELPVEPRIARMLVEASHRHCLPMAIDCAAIIAERDMLERGGESKLRQFAEPNERTSDLILRARALEAVRRERFSLAACQRAGVHAATARQVDQAAAQLRKACERAKLDLRDRSVASEVLHCLLVAYPDHVAVKLDDARPHCAMAGRRNVSLEQTSVIKKAGVILAIGMHEVGRGDQAELRLSLASEIDPAWLDSSRITSTMTTTWNDANQCAERVERSVYDGLVFASRLTGKPNAAEAEAMLVQRMADGSLRLERWDETVEQWIARVRCVADWFPDRSLLRYDEQDIRVLYHELASGCTRWNQVKDKDCLAVVRNALQWDQQQFVEKMAPADMALPTGRRMKLQYEPGAPPRGQAKIQDLYDWQETPRVAGGRQAVLLEILAPNYRPIQITSDLANFWKTLYPQVKAELRRRYPKHEWR